MSRDYVKIPSLVFRCSKDISAKLLQPGSELFPIILRHRNVPHPDPQRKNKVPFFPEYPGTDHVQGHFGKANFSFNGS